MRYLIAAALLAPAVLLGWPAAAEPPSCASLGGSVEAGQMCRVHATGPNYMLTMTFPTDYPDQQALTDYITQNRDGFVNVAQSSGARPAVPAGGHHRPAQRRSAAAQHPQRGAQVLPGRRGTRSSIWYKAFNYNLGTKQPITFDTLFPPGTTPLDAIFPIVQRDLERQTPLGAAILPSTGHDPSHYQNFAITDDQLIFYFAPGEMLPAFGARPGPGAAQRDPAAGHLTTAQTGPARNSIATASAASATWARQPMIGTKKALLPRTSRYTATTTSATKRAAPPQVPRFMARSIQAGSPHF